MNYKLDKWLDKLARRKKNYVIMDKYLKEFNNKMKKQIKIPKSVVDNYFDNKYVMVDIDFIHAYEVIPRVSWFRLMKYEVNFYEVTTTSATLLSEEIDANMRPFSTYDTTKSTMTLETIVPKTNKKRKKDLEIFFGKGQVKIIEGNCKDEKYEEGYN